METTTPVMQGKGTPGTGPSQYPATENVASWVGRIFETSEAISIRSCPLVDSQFLLMTPYLSRGDALNILRFPDQFLYSRQRVTTHQ